MINSGPFPLFPEYDLEPGVIMILEIVDAAGMPTAVARFAAPLNRSSRTPRLLRARIESRGWGRTVAEIDIDAYTAPPEDQPPPAPRRRRLLTPWTRRG